jgi:acetyl esterase/lipase
MYTRRELLKASSVLAALPLLRRCAFAGVRADAPGNAAKDPLDFVNPQFRPTLKTLLPMLTSVPPLSAATVAAGRASEAREYSTVFARSSARLIPGSAGAPGVRVFVFGVAPGASKPAILHIHGGGYVGLGSGLGLRALQTLAADLDCVVVSVDYRLAPETKFPGSLEDNYAALTWMYTHAKELGIDVNRIAVKGESAGGGHAATLAIAVRDRKEFALCCQVLIYPMLDDRTGSTRPVPPSVGHFIWTPESNSFGWTSLLGIAAGTNYAPANSVPARVANLAGLPSAFIGVGSIDLFASEDLEYARHLLECGVSTECMLVPGAFHGFDLICGKAPLTVEFNRAWKDSLRRAFQT